MRMQEEFRHETVLLRESVEGILGDPDGIYVDCTLGGGGHSAALADRLSPSGCLVGIDQDPAALQAGRLRLTGVRPTVHVVQGNFREIGAVLDQLGIGQVDGILFDLGVSSHQIDLPQRGFSYMNNGPLDMRMNPEQSLTAQEIVNTYPETRRNDAPRPTNSRRGSWNPSSIPVPSAIRSFAASDRFVANSAPGTDTFCRSRKTGHESWAASSRRTIRQCRAEESPGPPPEYAPSESSRSCKN